MNNNSSLPKRVFNSPLIEYVNFKDNSFINLIRLIKPYANGDSYVVYKNTKSTFCSSKLFKTYEKAKQNFELMIKNNSQITNILNRGLTGN